MPDGDLLGLGDASDLEEHGCVGDAVGKEEGAPVGGDGAEPGIAADRDAAARGAKGLLAGIEEVNPGAGRLAPARQCAHGADIRPLLGADEEELARGVREGDIGEARAARQIEASDALAVDRGGDDGATVGHLDDVAGARADVEEERVLVPGGRVHHRDAGGVFVAEDSEVATKEEAELIALRLDGGLMHEIAGFDPVLAQRGVVGADVDGLAAGAPHDVERVDVADVDLARVPGLVGIARRDLGLRLGLGPMAPGAGGRGPADTAALSPASGVSGGASPTGDWRRVTMTTSTVATALVTTMAARGKRGSAALGGGPPIHCLQERHLRAPSTMSALHIGQGMRRSLIAAPTRPWRDPRARGPSIRRARCARGWARR